MYKLHHSHHLHLNQSLFVVYASRFATLASRASFALSVSSSSSASPSPTTPLISSLNRNSSSLLRSSSLLSSSSSLSKSSIARSLIVNSLFNHRYQFQNMSSASSSSETKSKKAKKSAYVDEFLDFVNASPTPFHVVETVSKLLESNGFNRLDEKEEKWELKPLQKYFLTRNQSTIIAFAVGGEYKSGNGFTIIGAHTDSPCLRLKPISDNTGAAFQQIGVETYGGGLWHTWFDRDLSVAGRVIVSEGNENNPSGFVSRLVRIERPILCIPNLAIHMNREVNDKGFTFNAENNLKPVLATQIKAALQTPVNEERKGIASRHSPLLVKLIADELQVSVSSIQDFELMLYDTQPSRVGGALDEFIHSARLDNQMMSFCATRALLASLEDKSLEKEVNIRMVALFDHEEIGSESAQGAASNMLRSLLERINGPSGFAAAIRKSFLVSADMAHGHHPNYGDKHEANHRPAFHKGLVVKENVNQRYATNTVTGFLMKHVAKRHGIPIQDFVVRQDMGCGSTIGPILAANCGMRTVDVGAPQFAMHSIREMCATEDVDHSVNLLNHFFKEFPALDATLKVD